MSYGVGLRNGVAFALGTIPSLTSGGGLRPSLMLNFLSGSLDPRITFSRGTQAMQYGSDGTLQYAPNNLLTYSNQADNAAWTKSNSFVQTNLLTFSDAAVANYTSISAQVVNTSPISGFTNSVAFPYTPATNIIAYKSYTTVAGIIYTLSAYVQMDDGGVPVVTTSPTAGDFTLVTENNPTPTNITVTSVGGGVYRVYASITALGGGTNTGVVKYNTQSARGFKVTGLQFVQGSVPGDYVATTSAALPVLYADYNGALRARKLCEGATTSAHFAYQNGPGAGQYILSEYLKAGERTRVALGNSFAGDYAVFDLSAGTVVSAGSGTVSGGTIISAGNGYYRCTASCAPSGVWNPAVVTVSTGTTTSYTGDGSSGIYIADAQLTPGYLPLAVTETTSAAVYGPRFDYDPSSLVTQNLLLYSNDWSNAIWSKTNITRTPAASIGPDGTLSMTKLEATASAGTACSQAFTASATSNTYSIYVKQGSGVTDANGFLVFNSTTSTVLAQLIINYGTGVITQAVGSGATATNVGNSIWRIVVPITSGINLGNSVGVYSCFPGASETAGEFAYVYGAQLNQGSTALPYTATTTAPYTLTTARGLLIEEQRTNLLLQSNDFQTSWSQSNVTRTLNSTLSPEGVVNGVKIEATTTAAGTSLIAPTATVAATAATYSIFVKQGTGATTANEFALRNFTTSTTLILGALNYSTGVWTYSTGSTGVVVTNVGNGWWRIAMTATSGITSGDTIRGYVGWTGGTATAGDFLYAYGAQLEAGAFAASYIPTVGSTATRNADSASITTLTPWFNAAAGTMFGAGTRMSVLAATGSIFEIGDGTNNNRFLMYADSPVPNGAYLVGNGGITQAAISVSNVFPANTAGKIASAYAVNDFQQASNGTLGLADTSGTLPTVTTAYIGKVGSSTAGQWNGWISSIRYYPTRLANASLQSITV